MVQEEPTGDEGNDSDQGKHKNAKAADRGPQRNWKGTFADVPPETEAQQEETGAKECSPLKSPARAVVSVRDNIQREELDKRSNGLTDQINDDALNSLRHLSGALG